MIKTRRYGHAFAFGANEANATKNPQNWPMWKKLFVTFEICLLTFSVYIGSAIFTPGIPTVIQDFGVSQVAATLGLTLFVGGYGLGPLLWSPMSEIPQIGRNPVYIATLIVFVALQVPTALAGNFGTLLAFRFLTGLFGSPALATVWILQSSSIRFTNQDREERLLPTCTNHQNERTGSASGVSVPSVVPC